MDLRRFGITREQALQGAKLLDYQPFILADDIQTGVAYEWLHAADEAGRYVAFRDQVTPQVWQRFTAANQYLRNMYDDWIESLCAQVPGAQTALDVAGNSGYFLQALARKGYQDCVGYDLLDKTEAFAFLNHVLGTNTRFIHRPYDSWKHPIPGCQPADVVIASAILLHISDPLYFLHFLGRMTRKAMFLFTRVIRADEYVLLYGEPNEYSKEAQFPVGFDNNNFISTGLLHLSLKKLGFREVIELPPQPSWVPQQAMQSTAVYLCLK
jgi:hypothetical protein